MTNSMLQGASGSDKGPASRLGIGGRFRFEAYRADGTCKWTADAKNGIPDAALNNTLDVMLGGATQTTTWYMGLIDNDGFTALTSGDTLGGHDGWAESTDYTGDRKEWSPGAASGKSISDGTPAEFTMDDTVAIKGAFLASTSGGTTGILFATAAFAGGTQQLSATDVLKVTYTISASAT